MFLRKWAAAVRARLIDDARRAWRLASVWIAGASAVLIGAWEALPGDMRTLLPSWVTSTVPILLFLAVIAGRLVKQPGATRG